jgi:hypothetical protein
MDTKEEFESVAQRLAAAYKATFGLDGYRSSDQQLVWDDLQARACMRSPLFNPDKLGEFSALRAAHIDGARTMILGIERQLRIGSKVEVVKPKVKRGDKKHE